MNTDLFVKTSNRYQPLADALRPTKLEDLLGQEHLLGTNGVLSRIAKSGKTPSLILWGTAGSGKSTIARILALNSRLNYQIMLATDIGTSELRDFFKKAKGKHLAGSTTILIIDEIHHFNRSQQDLFLPYLEEGSIILIGTTTENPSFELNSALLSRCRVITLKPLEEQALQTLITRAEEYLGKKLPLDEKARQELVNLTAGDGRYLLNLCEELFSAAEEKLIDSHTLRLLLQKRTANYDKTGDNHYNLISAFHKSLRGSDADAALYYLARMLTAGEEPHYVLRRLVRFASEDIGMADPEALIQALAAKESYDFLGSPEGDYAIANAVIYCATAPKSNSCYLAYKEALTDANNYHSLPPPAHILNAPTKLMRKQGLGVGYIYDHDTKDCFSGQEYFPTALLAKKSPRYYLPNSRGFEKEIIKRLDYWQKLRQKIRTEEG